jgi:hypothetical protein
MQRFPQLEENSTNALNNSRPFRSTDYMNTNVEVPIIKSSTNQTQKPSIPTGNGRARSCSGGRNKAMSPPVLSRKGILITKNNHKININILRIMWTSRIKYRY